jgi:hypothetical protein
MSIHLNPLAAFAATGHSSPKSAAIWLSDPSASQTAVTFASLVDLARIQFGTSAVEVCDACNTVNLGAAQYCKGCSHKLPAYYAAREDDLELALPPSPPARTTGFASRAGFHDFAALALVINLLVMVAEFMPFQ